MGNQDVVIHIGLSKCASTYLQKTIFPALGNYSDVAFSTDEDKYYLFRPDMKPALFREIVARHIQNPQPDRNRLLISCEDYTELLFQGFSDVFFQWKSIGKDKYTYSNEVIARNIARTYPNARIIIVIREQIDWALSRYKMIYRGGKTKCNIDELLRVPLEAYDAMIERYQKQFGKHNVLVLPFEMMRHDHAGFIKSITTFIGSNAEINPREVLVNAAPDLLGIVEYERLKNRWRLDIRKATWLTPPGQMIFQILARIIVALLKPYFVIRYSNRKHDVILTQETVDRLKPVIALSNSKVEKLTGLDLHRYGYLVQKDT